jgi:hypothetical protein
LYFYIVLNGRGKAPKFFREFPCIFEGLMLEGGGAVEIVDGG